MKHINYYIFAISVATLVSCSKDKTNQTVDLENATSSVNDVYVINTGIAADPAGFNMITDGGFERANWKTNTLWWHPEDIEESSEPCDGRSIRLFYNGEGWRDLAIQSLNLKKNQSYTLSLNFRGAWKGLNCYMGFRAAEGHDVCQNNPDGNDTWEEGYTYTWDNIDDTKADVFFGGWWWYDLWVELDNVKVIPTGSANDSYIPENASITATSIPSAASSKIESAEKTVVAQDASCGMFHNASVDGSEVENVFFISGLNKSGNLTLSRVISTTVSDFVPTGIIAVGGKYYVAGFSGFTPAASEDETDTCSKVSILVSEDGQNWSETASLPADGGFAKIAFCQKGDYIYLFGSPVASGSVNTFVARVAQSNIGNSAEYEYWDGETYVKNVPSVAASIFYGPTDCMSVVYNSENYAFMAVYRSFATDQLVYRDAGLAEGEWSGEKLLVADPENAKLYAPQVVVNSSNKLVMIASAQ